MLFIFYCFEYLLKIMQLCITSKIFGESLDLERGGVRLPELDIYSGEHVTRDRGVQIGV